MMLIISGLLTLGYVVLLLVYRYGWQHQQVYEPVNADPSVFVSVIIPARNEQDNISACIESVLAQRYPGHLLEVIVVDDHSEDNTAAIVKGFESRGVRYISLADSLGPGKINAYKKAALAAGISKSRGTLIVTTDADCTAPPYWLHDIAAMYGQRKPAMIVAPVIYTAGGGVAGLFQLIDFMSMQGITAASQKLKLGNMCNGANLAFSRAAYDAVGGYEGTQHLATGDDYLLMVKMAARYPQGIAYLKSDRAIVSTAPQPGWRSFLRQRIRWASKSGKYKDSRLTGILLFVYLFNLSLVVTFIAAFLNPALFLWVLGMLIVKTAAELYFIVPVADFFGKRDALWYFPLLQPVHVLYIVIAGLLGFVGGYEWKGRDVK